jgi:hypothetical protein
MQIEIPPRICTALAVGATFEVITVTGLYSNHTRQRRYRLQEIVPMGRHSILALVILWTCTILSAPSHAKSGRVFVEVAKGGLIVGASVGRGVLTYGGRDYRFRMTGLSLGLTAGISATRLEGHASNLHHLRDFAGTYAAVGIGGAWVLGVGDVRLKNDKGVTITLHGGRAGIELAANLSGIAIELEEATPEY